MYLVYKNGLVFLYIAVKDTKQAKASSVEGLVHAAVCGKKVLYLMILRGSFKDDD